MTAVAIQPLPLTRDRSGCPFSIQMVRTPSETTSTRPVAATTAPVAVASSRARSFTPSTSPAASTPRTAPERPASAATSPALPRQHATRTVSSNRRASVVRNELAPAPTGSKITGTPAALARRPARSIASIICLVSVPMFNTSALEAAAISSTSSTARAITGAAPTATVAFATSLTVTTLVMWCTSGRRSRTRTRSAAASAGVTGAGMPCVTPSSAPPAGGRSGRPRPVRRMGGGAASRRAPRVDDRHAAQRPQDHVPDERPGYARGQKRHLKPDPAVVHADERLEREGCERRADRSRADRLAERRRIVAEDAVGIADDQGAERAARKREQRAGVQAVPEDGRDQRRSRRVPRAKQHPGHRVDRVLKRRDARGAERDAQRSQGHPDRREHGCEDEPAQRGAAVRRIVRAHNGHSSIRHAISQNRYSYRSLVRNTSLHTSARDGGASDARRSKASTIQRARLSYSSDVYIRIQLA